MKPGSNFPELFRVFALCLFLLAGTQTTAEVGADSSLEELTVRAESGDVKAQYWLGIRFFNGDDETPMDLPGAAAWLRKAADANDANAQALLGYMQVSACGIPLNVEEGLAWLHKAAETNNTLALYDLGDFYEMGRGGVEPDRFEAMDWYIKAAEKGHEKATSDLARLRRTADEARTGHVSNEWWTIPVQELTEKAEQGDAEAQRKLGIRYKGFGGVPLDLDKARYWLEQSAAQSNLQAHLSLAQLHVYATRVDPEKAFYHCSIAAEGGDSAAQRVLGGYYRNGFGTAIDRAKALHWFILADKNKDSRAAKSMQSLVKGKANILKYPPDAPPVFDLQIRDLENRERTVQFLAYDPVNQLVSTDYMYGETSALPLAAFDKEAVRCIEEPETYWAFLEKTTLDIDMEEMTAADREEHGYIDGKNGPAVYSHKVVLYRLRFKNRSKVDLKDLRLEYRIFCEEADSWTYPNRRNSVSNWTESASFRIPVLKPGEVWQKETPRLVLQSHNLTGADYYTDGSPARVTQTLKGVWVKVFRPLPGERETSIDRSEPYDLPSKVVWKNLPGKKAN